LVHDPSFNWADDTQNWKKAYLFACLSELVYLRMSKYELRGKDRYKVIPSAALRFLLENDIDLDLSQVMTEASELRAAFTESATLVLGISVLRGSDLLRRAERPFSRSEAALGNCRRFWVSFLRVVKDGAQEPLIRGGRDRTRRWSPSALQRTFWD
jgi:hypothetical protein